MTEVLLYYYYTSIIYSFSISKNKVTKFCLKSRNKIGFSQLQSAFLIKEALWWSRSPNLVKTKIDHVLGRDYDRNSFFVTLNSSSSNLNSVRPKLSAFYVDYIVATSIIPYMEISHYLVTK